MQDEYSARCIFAQMPAISIWTAVQLSRLSILHELSSTDTPNYAPPHSMNSSARASMVVTAASDQQPLKHPMAAKSLRTGWPRSLSSRPCSRLTSGMVPTGAYRRLERGQSPFRGLQKDI